MAAPQRNKTGFLAIVGLLLAAGVAAFFLGKRDDAAPKAVPSAAAKGSEPLPFTKREVPRAPAAASTVAVRDACARGDKDACAEVDAIRRRVVEKAAAAASVEQPPPAFVERLADRCKKGELDACYAQGRLLARATDRAERAKAIPVYQAACKAGHLPSCGEHAIEVMVSGDAKAAREELDAVCKKGDGNSCAYLARMDNRGDVAKALPQYEKACEMGGGFGCRMVALHFAEKDPIKSADFFDQACRAGDDVSCK